MTRPILHSALCELKILQSMETFLSRDSVSFFRDRSINERKERGQEAARDDAGGEVPRQGQAEGGEENCG